MLTFIQTDLIGGLGTAISAVVGSANLLLLGILGGVFITRHRRMEIDIRELRGMVNGDVKSVLGKEVEKLEERIDRHAIQIGELRERIR